MTEFDNVADLLPRVQSEIDLTIAKDLDDAIGLYLVEVGEEGIEGVEGNSKERPTQVPDPAPDPTPTPSATSTKKIKGEHSSRSRLLDMLNTHFRNSYNFVTNKGGHGLHVFTGKRYMREYESAWLRDRLQDYAKTSGSLWKIYLEDPARILKSLTHVLEGKQEKIWDAPRENMLNLNNGLLDLNTMTLHPHNPDWLSTICLPVDYPDEVGNPKFDNPEPWDRFIASLFPDDSPELVTKL